MGRKESNQTKTKVQDFGNLNFHPCSYAQTCRGGQVQSFDIFLVITFYFTKGRGGSYKYSIENLYPVIDICLNNKSFDKSQDMKVHNRSRI